MKKIIILSLIALTACSREAPRKNVATALATQTAQGGTVYKDHLVSTVTLQPRTLAEVTGEVRNGQVILMGEIHTRVQDHSNQLRLIQKLMEQNNVAPISVAMEFFDYTKQSFVDQYTSGKIAEGDFLKSVQWKGGDFNLYRGLVQAPSLNAGRTYAINIPSSIASHVFLNGLDSLNDDEKSKFPPDFELGDSKYKKRFIQISKLSHPNVPMEMMDDMFIAQSLWDDTMAWKISEALAENPYQVIVVIVGAGHVQYGMGLAARLKARGVIDILNIAQVPYEINSPADVSEFIYPDPEYGPIGDYVWVQ